MTSIPFPSLLSALLLLLISLLLIILFYPPSPPLPSESPLSFPLPSPPPLSPPPVSISPPLISQKYRKRDIYEGKWVRDETNRSLYEPKSCPYVDEAFACMENGRPDDEFVYWRWEPLDCPLPRWNATDFLHRLRGKRLMLDYNCTVEFVRSHFLVREGTRLNRLGNSNPTLSIDKIDKSANRWKKADILVFNTGHWWTHGKTARGKNYYMEGDVLYPKFDAIEAYRRAIKTWAKWIEKNMDPTKNTVFYRGYSTAHFRGGDWDSGGSCHGERTPILSGPLINSYPLKMRIVEEIIREMKFPFYLNYPTRAKIFRIQNYIEKLMIKILKLFIK
ncbi:hypothetical protein LUZ60_017243 [Juncus effusus]|nr:hypothetical protein LUZ60_017243 [Juncus effusus]